MKKKSGAGESKTHGGEEKRKKKDLPSEKKEKDRKPRLL